jgi:hypothetical protein
MKFTKLLVIILVAGMLVVYYILGTGYSEQRRQKAALTAEIAGATQQLALIPLTPTDLEHRLAAAGADLDTARNAFPTQLNSTRIINAILILAEESGVKAVPVITQPWSMVSVNEVDFPIFRLNVAVKGSFTRIANFISRLENGEPETMVIGDLKVDRVAGPPADESETSVGLTVEASLDIAVYARPPIPGPSDEVEE